MLCVSFNDYAKCHDAEGHNAKYHDARCHDAEGHYADCPDTDGYDAGGHNAECPNTQVFTQQEPFLFCLIVTANLTKCFTLPKYVW